METIFLTFSGIFFLAVASTIKTNNCHPSSPGKGSKLTMAKFTEIMPHNCKNLEIPRFFKIFVDSKPIAKIPRFRLTQNAYRLYNVSVVKIRKNGGKNNE